MMGLKSGTASTSACGRYRYTLGRKWDERPVLAVCMFNPSTADHRENDPTISLLSHIASHNGYGGMEVVNVIPLRSSKPAEAIDMVSTWDKRQAWEERDALHWNAGCITREVERAGAVLIAWGALAERCSPWVDLMLEEIQAACYRGGEAPDAPVYCLGRTKGGHPIHPLARGKHKVPKDRKFVLWGGQ